MVFFSFLFFSFQVVGAEGAAMSSKGLNRVCKRFMLRLAGFCVVFFWGGVLFFFLLLSSHSLVGGLFSKRVFVAD